MDIIIKIINLTIIINILMAAIINYFVIDNEFMFIVVIFKVIVIIKYLNINIKSMIIVFIFMGINYFNIKFMKAI